MSPKVTFMANKTPDTEPRRVAARKACENCRQRKKRCSHQSGITPYPHPPKWVRNNSISESSHRTISSIKLAGQENLPRPSNQQMKERDYSGIQVSPTSFDKGQLERKITERHHPHPQTPRLARSFSPTTSRFVGDLNPEARLHEEKTSPEDVKHAYSDNVGLWIHSASSKQSEQSERFPSALNSSQREPTCCRSRVREIMSQETVKTLSKLYFANLHPIIPLLNEVEYWQCLARCTISTPLVHAVCLIAAKDSAAEKDLRLLHSKDVVVPVRKFCRQVFLSVKKSISQPVLMRKITMMRILGLLSLHHEGSDGAEHASSYISQAIHYAQSLALHLPRPNDTEGDLKRAFWCLWTLDRLNSAINSRPCFIADMDIAVPDLTSEESGHVAFNVWLRVAKMLNRVIGLYRPNNEGGLSSWDSGFPGFEQIIDETNAWDLPPSTIATLHIFYLATSILAHRLKTIKVLPTPGPSRLRQQLATIQVIRYMQDPIRMNALHPLPIVVYAASLALSVSYQQLRYSRLSCNQEDAREDFNIGCGILQELRQKWSSADAMAVLAKKISGALDKLPHTDILRLNQPTRKKGDGQLEGNLTSVIDQRPYDMSTTSSSHNFPTGSCLETMSVFAGMDDLSWMYLDVENPVCFDRFPEFDDLCSAW